MKKRILFILFAAAFCTISLSILADVPSVFIKIKKTGNLKLPVLFNHSSHSSITDCEGCHSAVKIKSAAHKKCKGCHQVTSGPTNCNSCHNG